MTLRKSGLRTNPKRFQEEFAHSLFWLKLTLTRLGPPGMSQGHVAPRDLSEVLTRFDEALDPRIAVAVPGCSPGFL